MRSPKKPMSANKIRIVAFTITGVLCAAIVVIGLNYVNRLRSRSNAELTVTTNMEAIDTTEETTEAAEKDIQITTVSETRIYTESSAEEPVQYLHIDEVYCDASGCHAAWHFEEINEQYVVGIELRTSEEYIQKGNFSANCESVDLTMEDLDGIPFEARFSLINTMDFSNIETVLIPIENRIPTEEANISENQGFEITAYADSTGCYLSWTYGEDYQNCVLRIELTDGATDYRTVAAIGIDLKEYFALSEEYAGTIGARIVIIDNTDSGLVEREVRTIVVENRNVAAVDAADIIGAESGYDISSLFS